MSYKFVVEFRGLCAFVPSHGIDQQNDLISVLLVNAGETAKDNFNVPLDLHFPMIRCQLGDLENAGSGPDEAQFVMPLSREDIVIAPQSTTSPPVSVTLGVRPPGQEAPANQAQDADFSWVPKLEDVLMNAGELNPDCLELNPVEGRVIARVHLTEGDLKTVMVGRFNGVPVVTEFRAADTPSSVNVLRQAIATRAGLELDVDGPVTILTRKFDGSPGRKIVFRPAAAGGERRIQILNLCADALLESEDFQARKTPTADVDFAWFYLLSNALAGNVMTNLDVLPIPRPLPLPLAVFPGGGEPARCTKTTFKAPVGGLQHFSQLVTSIKHP